MAALVFGLVYRLFTFSQDPLSFSFRKQKGERPAISHLGGIPRVVLPRVDFDFSFLQHLKTTWKLSNLDFKYIVTNWPFIGITLAGLIVLLIEHAQSGNFRGMPMLPVT
jgi:ABC-2 type transport system permease protein